VYSIRVAFINWAFVTAGSYLTLPATLLPFSRAVSSIRFALSGGYGDDCGLHLLLSLLTEVAAVPYYQPAKCTRSPAPSPTAKLMAFICRKSLIEYASSGSIPCPSCTMELARRTLKGTVPFAKSITNMR